MNYSYLLQLYALTAMAARRTLLIRQFGVAAALAVALALGAGLLSVSSTAMAQNVGPPPATSININAADADTMAAGLKGVGQSRALEIVRYREAYGPFASIEELAEVKGIGKSTLEKNRTLITLE
jgi:competence protein ComEA